MADNENNLDNALDIEQLEEVTGGTSPRYPEGLDLQKRINTNLVLNNIFENLKKNEADKIKKPFDICPKCGSKAVSFNRVENICMCQDCGYCEDRSK